MRAPRNCAVQFQNLVNTPWNGSRAAGTVLDTGTGRPMLHHPAASPQADRGTFLMRILPYRTVHDVIDGVVVTFFGVTQVKEAEQRALAAKVYAENPPRDRPQVGTIWHLMAAVHGR